MSDTTKRRRMLDELKELQNLTEYNEISDSPEKNDCSLPQVKISKTLNVTNDPEVEPSSSNDIDHKIVPDKQDNIHDCDGMYVFYLLI